MRTNFPSLSPPRNRFFPSVVLIFTVSFDAYAWPSYTLTDLGDLLGGDNYSSATALNNLGQVTGVSGTLSYNRKTQSWDQPNPHAFLWTNGTLQDLGTPQVYTAIGTYNVTLTPVIPEAGSSPDGLVPMAAVPELVSVPLPSPGYVGSSYPHGINDQGQVVVDAARGSFAVAVDLSYAGDLASFYGTYIWSKGSIQPVNGIVPATINNQGLIGGAASNQAALWQDNTTTVLGLLDKRGNAPSISLGESPVRVTALNDQGMAVGVSNNIAFAWSQATGMVELDVFKPQVPTAFNWNLPEGAICACMSIYLPSYTYSAATDVNNLGEVVGYSSDGAFLWKDGSVEYFEGKPNAINNASLVVGNVSDSLTTMTGFLWSRTAGTVNINSLLMDSQGWTITDASDINDAGQIAATGIKNGITHALLLSPLSATASMSDAAAVPLPSAAWLFASALAGLGLHRRRISPLSEDRRAA